MTDLALHCLYFNILTHQYRRVKFNSNIVIYASLSAVHVANQSTATPGTASIFISAWRLLIQLSQSQF